MNASHISQHGDHGGLLLLHLPVGVHPIDPGEVRLPGHLEQAVPGGGASLSYKVLHMKIEKTFLFEDFLFEDLIGKGWIFHWVPKCVVT